ncbi:hypothetical protein DV515_00004359 [Chloebia gouldiae]|uniref:Uncharacterized protein n=1 Tax=Chloebia gouldiae TaxID=44316 RepID=A0A3L8SQX2_CHLGU|nr:hypothetical protein DV515_00004359 [Chloebia gouldiae]
MAIRETAWYLPWQSAQTPIQMLHWVSYLLQREAHCKKESEGPEQQWQAGMYIEEVMDKFRDDAVWSVMYLRFQSLLYPRRVLTGTPRAVPP